MDSISVDNIMAMKPCYRYADRAVVDKIFQDLNISRATLSDVYECNLPNIDKIWVLVATDITTDGQCLAVKDMMAALMPNDSQEYARFVQNNDIIKYRPIMDYLMRTSDKPPRQLLIELEQQIVNFFKSVT